MIIGVGIDIIEIKRINKWLNNTKLIERFFHPDEIKAIPHHTEAASLFIAARFAAKEAFGKSLGIGLSNLALKDISVVNNEKGKPEINLYGTALKALKETGADKVHLSLTHEKTNAVAVVILEQLAISNEQITMQNAECRNNREQ